MLGATIGISIIAVFTIVCIIFVLFFERKTSSSRISWLLALIFLPGIGIILYVLLSGHFFTKNNRMKKADEFIAKTLRPHVKKQEAILTANETIKNTLIEHYKTLIEMNLMYSSSILTFDDSIDIFLWGKDKFESLCSDLEKAKVSINIAYFIFHNDEIGTKVMDILCKKAHEGVKVQLMYDDFGCLRTPSRFFKRLNEAGGVARPFFPIRNGILFSLNYRNHRKIVVIDNTIGYVGGFNIGDEYVNRSRRKKVLWRDTHIRITGMSVFMLQLVFLIDWVSIGYNKFDVTTRRKAKRHFPIDDLERLSKSILEKSTHVLAKDQLSQNLIPVQIVASGPDNFNSTGIKDAIIRMIMNAKKTVYIQTPYFTPDETFFNVLKIVAHSGIDVRIMVPDKWDKAYARAAAFDYIREMLDFGVKFYHYPGFIHSKLTVVDGEVVTIGTTNIDTRSFALNFEVNAFVYDKNFAEKNLKIFLDDQTKCRQSKKEWFDNKPLMHRAWWGFCRLLSPIM